MSHDSRAQILGQLQEHLQSPVLSYVTGDRNGLATQIAADQLVLFPRHLAGLDQAEQLNLVLYTRGGETTAAWPIMSFLREHCTRLRVLVPFYAHSAGTLLSLGADEIIMTRYATLSPIDPTVANAFNPQDPANPANPANRLAIAVEDVMAFLQLAKDHASGSQLPEDAFRKLSDSVHPLALGNVQRSINQIRQLAKKMLALHTGPEANDIDTLVNALTTEFYSHQHLVNRREAAEMGLPVISGDEKMEQLLLDYYEELCTDLELRNKWDPADTLRQAAAAVGGVGAPVQPASAPPGTTLPGQPVSQPPSAAPAGSLTVPVSVERAYLETPKTCDAYITEGAISQVVTQQQMVAGMPVQVAVPQVATKFEVFREDWKRLS
jgi:hypothetical protein